MYKYSSMLLNFFFFYLVNPTSALHMKAELPTKKDFQVELYRTGNFTQVTDTLISVQLKDSRLLHGKINWRPEMFADAMVLFHLLT